MNNDNNRFVNVNDLNQTAKIDLIQPDSFDSSSQIDDSLNGNFDFGDGVGRRNISFPSYEIGNDSFYMNQADTSNVSQTDTYLGVDLPNSTKNVISFEQQYMTPMAPEQKEDYIRNLEIKADKKRKNRKFKLIKNFAYATAIVGAIGVGAIGGNVVTAQRDAQIAKVEEQRDESSNVIKTKSDKVLEAYTGYVMDNIRTYASDVSYQGAQKIAQRFEEQNTRILSSEVKYYDSIELFGDDPNLKLNVGVARDKFVNNVVELSDMCYDFSFYNMMFNKSVFKDAVTFEGDANVYIPIETLQAAGIANTGEGKNIDGKMYVEYHSLDLGNKDAVHINL